MKPFGAYLSGGVVYGYERSSGGSFTTIKVPGAMSTLATGINGAGLVVGTYNMTTALVGSGFFDQAGNQGFLYDGTTFKTVNFPGAALTDVVGINNAGVITGMYSDTPGSPTNHVFFYDGSTFTTVDVPGAVNTFQGLGINNSNQFVGVYCIISPCDTFSDFRGFLATPVTAVPEPSNKFLFELLKLIRLYHSKIDNGVFTVE